MISQRWVALSGLATVLVFAAMIPSSMALVGFGTSPVEAAPLVVRTPSPPTRDQLSCFECHSEKHYMDGDEADDEHFGHREHLEEVSHCHTCHAFQGHFQVSVRRGVCDECH